MRFAYADPPYLGQSALYKEHPNAAIWDDPAAHTALLQALQQNYPDGWAISLSAPSLSLYQNAMPRARLCVWTKPFAIFKPNVGVAYTWEPVLLMGGRKRTREQPTVRDHLSENITLRKGLTGAKPLRFNQWILGLLNWRCDDFLHDVFPGTGGMQEAIRLGVHDLGGPRKQ